MVRYTASTLHYSAINNLDEHLITPLYERIYEGISHNSLRANIEARLKASPSSYKLKDADQALKAGDVKTAERLLNTFIYERQSDYYLQGMLGLGQNDTHGKINDSIAYDANGKEKLNDYGSLAYNAGGKLLNMASGAVPYDKAAAELYGNQFQAGVMGANIEARLKASPSSYKLKDADQALKAGDVKTAERLLNTFIYERQSDYYLQGMLGLGQNDTHGKINDSIAYDANGKEKLNDYGSLAYNAGGKLLNMASGAVPYDKAAAELYGNQFQAGVMGANIEARLKASPSSYKLKDADQALKAGDVKTAERLLNTFIYERQSDYYLQGMLGLGQTTHMGR